MLLAVVLDIKMSRDTVKKSICRIAGPNNIRF